MPQVICPKCNGAFFQDHPEDVCYLCKGNKPMPKRFHNIYVTITTPNAEFDAGYPEATSLDAVANDVLADHPDCTSMVIVVVPSKAKKGEEG